MFKIIQDELCNGLSQIIFFRLSKSADCDNQGVQICFKSVSICIILGSYGLG